MSLLLLHFLFENLAKFETPQMKMSAMKHILCYFINVEKFTVELEIYKIAQLCACSKLFVFAIIQTVLLLLSYLVLLLKRS